MVLEGLAGMLEETGFGYIVVNGKRYSHDIVLYPDGKVRKRRKDLSKKYRNRYGHTPLSREELELYVEESGNIEYLVIGTGQYGVLPLTPDAKKYIGKLEEKGVKIIIDKTPNILSIINRLEKEDKRVLAIIHTTC